MAIGISTDPAINCKSFADTLVTLDGVEFAGFWQREGENGVFSLLYSAGEQLFVEEYNYEQFFSMLDRQEWHTTDRCSDHAGRVSDSLSMHYIRVNSSITLLLCADTELFTEEFLQSLKRLINKLGISLYGCSAIESLNEEIIARKNAEQILIDNNRRFSEVFSGTKDGTWDWDVRTNKAVFSEEWGQMFGYSADELTDDVALWLGKIYPDDAPGTILLIDAHLSGDSDIYTAEYRLQTKSGRYKWILDRGKAVRDKDGNAVRMVGTHQDIDYRKKLELKLSQLNENLEFLVKQRTKELSISNSKLKKEIENREKAESEALGRLKDLEHAYEKIKAAQSAMVIQEKMASIGQLASGVAHELNNPFGFITSNFHVLKNYFENFSSFVGEIKTTPLLSESSDPESELHNLLIKYNIAHSITDSQAIFRESQEGFSRISSIVDSLLAFARADSGKKRIFNVNDAIRSTLAVAGSEIKYVADIVEEFSEVPDTEFNVGEFNQVVLNILLNALYAIKEQNRSDQGVIIVKTACDNTNIYVDITDDGPGIPVHIQNRVFDAFFSTKPTGVGTGLGLNIAYDIIVNRHRGQIDLVSEPGMTKFSLVLPVV